MYRSYYDTGEFMEHRRTERTSVEVDEPEPWVDTGLIDTHGGRIMRYSGLRPIGFLHDR